MNSSAVHRSADRLKLWILWILVVAFLLAMPLMFVHPGLVISLFWLGLIIVGACFAIGGLVAKTRRAIAKHALKRSECPHCHAPIHEDPHAGGEWHCQACGADYLSTGEEIPSPT